MKKEELKKEIQEIKPKGDLVKNRGAFKIYLATIRDQVSRKYIKAPYKYSSLKAFCYIAEIVEELCWKYEIIPSIYLVAVGTGITPYLLNSIINSQEYDVIRELNRIYEMDYEAYFNDIYDKTFTKESVAKIGTNIRHAYPIYCILTKVREAEKDARIERGKLGDITQLNASMDLGGFGYARPSMVVDNRQIVIEDKSKLLSKYVDNIEMIEESVEVEGKAIHKKEECKK